LLSRYGSDAPQRTIGSKSDLIFADF